MEKSFPAGSYPEGSELFETIKKKTDSHERLTDFEFLLHLFIKILNTVTRDELGFKEHGPAGEPF